MQKFVVGASKLCIQDLFVFRSFFFILNILTSNCKNSWVNHWEVLKMFELYVINVILWDINNLIAQWVQNIWYDSWLFEFFVHCIFVISNYNISFIFILFINKHFFEMMSYILSEFRFKNHQAISELKELQSEILILIEIIL